MLSATANATPHRHPLLSAIVWGGVLAGTCDLIFALVYFGSKGATAVRVLQTIAGGALGRATYEGGNATALLGFALHYVNAFIIAAIYVAAARRLPVLLRRAVASGLLYGVGVYYVMNLVVVPLSAYRKPPLPLAFDPYSILAHALVVGLPIAFAARRFLTPPRS